MSSLNVPLTPEDYSAVDCLIRYAGHDWGQDAVARLKTYLGKPADDCVTDYVFSGSEGGMVFRKSCGNECERYTIDSKDGHSDGDPSVIAVKLTNFLLARI